MKYLKRFFESEDFDFFKSIENPEQVTKYDFFGENYNSVDKAVVCGLMICSEDEKTIKVLNLQERLVDKEYVQFFDGAKSYTFTVNYVTLPKSQIEIISEVSEVPGFTYIRIPYWLYKNNPGLKIQRVKVKKRFKNADVHRHLNKSMIDENVKRYLDITDKDPTSHRFMLSFIK
jgi:hypothetical protein